MSDNHGGAAPGLRRRGNEAGFSLIELLVVMLILGILAAIAITVFLNQKTKATDAGAKATARTLQTAMDTCGIENNGNYSSCDITVLRAIEKSIPQSGDDVIADPGNPAGGWTVSAESRSGNTFEIERDDDVVTRTCTVPSGNDRGGCPPSGNW